MMGNMMASTKNLAMSSSHRCSWGNHVSSGRNPFFALGVFAVGKRSAMLLRRSRSSLTSRASFQSPCIARDGGARPKVIESVSPGSLQTKFATALTPRREFLPYLWQWQRQGSSMGKNLLNFPWGATQSIAQIALIASASSTANAPSPGSSFAREIDVINQALSLRITVGLHDRIGERPALPRFDSYASGGASEQQRYKGPRMDDCFHNFDSRKKCRVHGSSQSMLTVH